MMYLRPLKYAKVMFAAAVMAVTVAVWCVPAQAPAAPQIKSQEVSEDDGIPVLIKHLPEWENLRDRTTLANNTAGLKAALGERPVLDLIDFKTGTEAVTAPYDAGKLLIIEYSNPQSSIEADGLFIAKLAETGEAGTVYRRVGNYNVFVFDAADPAAAAALIDLIKYEKNIQWLGDDPFLLRRAERAFITTTSQLFLSTVLVILIGIGISILIGLLVGLIYFMRRERRRAAMSAFTDAGGMTRLNLDGFTPDIVPDRLLGK